jgi:hypothetical protein
MITSIRASQRGQIPLGDLIMQRFVAIFSLLMALGATAFPAFAENRVALVIGENAYEHVQPLLKAVRDAKG